MTRIERSDMKNFLCILQAGEYRKKLGIIEKLLAGLVKLIHYPLPDN
jgi:hypothetical protein